MHPDLKRGVSLWVVKKICPGLVSGDPQRIYRIGLFP